MIGRLSFRVLIAACAVLAATSVHAATKFSKTGARTWSTNNDWTTSCGGSANAGRPANGDDVVICQGSVVSIDTNTATLASITINAAVGATAAGVLHVGTTNTARTVTVTGDVTNNGTFDITSGSNTTHTLVFGGNLTNAGTFDMAVDANSFGQVTFNASAVTGGCNAGIFACISGAGARTRFHRLIVSLGASAANILEYTASDIEFSSTGCLVLAKPSTLTITSANNCFSSATNPATGGTFKLSASGTNSITPFDNAPVGGWPTCMAIGSTAGYWLNSASTTVTVNSHVGSPCDFNVATTPPSVVDAMTITLDGSTFRVTSGTLNFNTTVDQRIRLSDTPGSTYWQEGGTVNIGGRLTSVNNTDGGTIQLDGGTLTLGANGNTDDATNTFGPFFLGSGTTTPGNANPAVFNMSGGTMVIRSTPTGGANAYDNRAGTSTVTGGTLQIGDASTAAGQTLTLRSDSAPVWDLIVNSTNSPIASLQTAFNVKDDLTISTGATLVTNNFNIAVGSGNNSGVWTNNGTFTPGTGAVTFNGTGSTQAQSIAGTSATTFYDLTVNKSSTTTLSIGTSPTVTHTLTLTAGTLATGTNKISLAAAATVSRTGGVTPAAVVSTNHVTGNFEKALDATNRAFTYPVGDGCNYTPIGVSFSATGFSAGNLTATTVNSTYSSTLSGAITSGATTLVVNSATGVPAVNFRVCIDSELMLVTGVSGTTLTVTRGIGGTTAAAHSNGARVLAAPLADHPDTTGGRTGIDAANSVNRYWTLKNSTASGTYDATLYYLAAASAVDLDAGAPTLVGRGEACTSSANVRVCNPWGRFTGSVTGNSIATGTTGTSLILLNGDLDADFVAGQTVSPRFVRQKEFIYTRELY